MKSDWELKSFEQAETKAVQETKKYGRPHIAVDRGQYHHPQFSTIAIPQIGDPISYAFNGDYYPDGYIKSISKTLKVVTSTTGNKYYRRRQTGSWIKNGTWSMVQGHIERQNPSF